MQTLIAISLISEAVILYMLFDTQNVYYNFMEKFISTWPHTPAQAYKNIYIIDWWRCRNCSRRKILISTLPSCQSNELGCTFLIVSLASKGRRMRNTAAPRRNALKSTMRLTMMAKAARRKRKFIAEVARHGNMCASAVSLFWNGNSETFAF